ncbi:hypothetical protein M9H77_16581 [Catharanthus roseus]|uniref:Uncharacterized protein n=1 Tax=Catharanthus roseus TaxID=4058 RepID=A0ACC0B2J8_CATRO|nr:hypothetical protein M9H77_16581 [Catharanthus roseus]
MLQFSMFFEDVLYNVVRGLYCTWLVPRMRDSSNSVDDLDSGEWIHLKKGVVPWKARPNRSMWTPHHALWWDGRLVESQKGIETKVGHRADLEGALVSESSKMSLSSLYSLREIVLERDPIPIIDLSNSETVERPVVQGVEPGVSIEEDSSETDSDAGMLPEPERVAPVDAEGMDSLVADGSPVEAAGQQISELREEISRVDALFCKARQAHRQAAMRVAMLETELVQKHVRFTTFQSCRRGCVRNSQSRQPEPIRENTPRPEQATHTIMENFMIRMTELLETSITTKRNERVRATGANEALEQFLKFRPPEFYQKQRPRYEEPGNVRNQCPEMQQVPPETSRKTSRPPAMRGATEERSDKPQMKAKVYTLDGLPVDTEAEVVESDFLRVYDNLRRSISRTSKGRAVTDWMQAKIQIELDYSTKTALSQCIEAMLHIGVAFSKRFIIAVKQVSAVHKGYGSSYDLVFGSVRGLHCTWLVSHTRASSNGMDDLDSGEWIHLKRGIVPWRAWPNRSTWRPHHALRWDGRLVESQERLETKVGPRADLVNSG